MKTYLKRLAEQIEEAEGLYGEPYDNAVKRLSGGKLEAGARCSWCFADDLKFWCDFEKGKMPHPKDWFYEGIIMPIPNHDGRRELEPDKCVVCVMDYPIEKENPEVDWVPLLTLLTSPGLHLFHVMETVRMMMPKSKPANEKS
jgi:hypothetical protein